MPPESLWLSWFLSSIALVKRKDVAGKFKAILMAKESDTKLHFPIYYGVIHLLQGDWIWHGTRCCWQACWITAHLYYWLIFSRWWLARFKQGPPLLWWRVVLDLRLPTILLKPHSYLQLAAVNPVCPPRIVRWLFHWQTRKGFLLLMAGTFFLY